MDISSVTRVTRISVLITTKMETPFCSMKECELDLKKKKIVFGRTDYENENKNIGIKLGIEHSRNMFVMDIDDDQKV